jgi:hypothetical protein
MERLFAERTPLFERPFFTERAERERPLFARRAARKAQDAPEAPEAPDKADEPVTSETITLFDGKTLDGWIEFNNTDASFNRRSFDGCEMKSLAAKLLKPDNRFVALVNATLSDAVKTELEAVNFDDAAAVDTLKNNLAKDFTRIVTGDSIFYNAELFGGVTLREETKKLAESGKLTDYDKARLNRMLLVDSLGLESQKAGWIVKEDFIASTGLERGALYTTMDFERFRIMFDVRHQPSPIARDEHQAGVLIFCTRPADGAKPLDSLGGIQFQVPRGHHWDYRPGKNNSGTFRNEPEKNLFKRSGNSDKFNQNEWSRVEIWADATKGIAKMAVAQPIGSKAVLSLEFEDPTAGKVGPFGLQMHNAGLFDEFRNITVEINPVVDGLITIE